MCSTSELCSVYVSSALWYCCMVLCMFVVALRLAYARSERQSSMGWHDALPRADLVCSQGCSTWWTELCSTDSSQIANSSIVIFLKSVTWAHRVAVLGWQAAVLLMNYFTVFTLSNCPQFTSVLGALCSALTCRASVNERFGLTSRKRSVAEGEETLHSDCMYYLIKMNSKGFLSFIAPLSIYRACMLFLNTPIHRHIQLHVWLVSYCSTKCIIWWLEICTFRHETHHKYWSFGLC